MIASNNLGLCVLVDDSATGSLIHSLAVKNPQVNFEWVVPSSVQNSDGNVREVVPDNSISAYATGWVAGQAALNENDPIIGVLADAPTVSKSQIEQVLAAAATASANLTLVPVSLVASSTGTSSFNAAVGGANSTNGLNSTSYTSTSNPATTSAISGTLSLPRILIVTRSLSQNELQMISSAGTVIYSLMPMTSNNVLASQPELVPMSAVEADLVAFRNGTWKPGIVQFFVNPPIKLTSVLVPQTVRSGFGNVVKELGQNPNLGQQQYNLQSAQSKLNWQPMLQNAHV